MICSYFDRKQFYFRIKSQIGHINSQFRLTPVPLQNNDLIARTPTKKHQFTITKQFYPSKGYKSASKSQIPKTKSSEKCNIFTPNKTKSLFTKQISDKRLFSQLQELNRKYMRQTTMKTQSPWQRRHVSCKNDQTIQKDSTFFQNVSIVNKQKTQRKFRLSRFKPSINYNVPKYAQQGKQSQKVQGWKTAFDEYQNYQSFA